MAYLKNLLKLRHIPHIIVLALLLFGIIYGCTFIPEQEQLVSVRVDKTLTRTSGNCEQTSLQDQGQTDEYLPGLDPLSISLLDWNIYKEKRDNWMDDFISFSRQKDIILLQEASLNEQLQQVLKDQKLYWDMNCAFKYNGMATGVLVASRIQPLGSCGLRNNEPIICVPKTILVSRYKITGSARQLLVANIHGINITLGTGSYREQLEGLQDILQEHTGPVILAGDFNNWSQERTDIMDSVIKKLSLQILTFDDSEGRTLFWGSAVDHVLYRGLEPVSHAVHQVTSSDHNPISVTFRLSQSQIADTQ